MSKKMLQSRLAAGMGRSWLSVRRSFGHRLASFGSASTGRTADPSVHSGGDGADPNVYPRDPEGIGDVANPEPATDEVESKRHYWPGKQAESEALSSQRPPRTSSTRLESTPVNQPLDPNFQQKRRCSGLPPLLESASCTVPDPWPKDAETKNPQGSREGQTKSDREYYKDRKASPLSEMEMADTRKPITRATDGTAAPADYGTGRDVTGWTPEQVDTAEGAMKRATEIWKANAACGDPETFKHSRVLREMRGEWF